jgi:lactoylglutathione lyase
MIKKLAHICFRTENLKEMVAFYRDRLGFRVQFVFKNKAGEEFGYYFDLGHQSYLEIFDHRICAKINGQKSQALFAQSEFTLYQHLCLEVTDIESEVIRLRGKGITVTDTFMGGDFSKQAWFKDPDNNPIELMEYTAQSLQTRMGNALELVIG